MRKKQFLKWLREIPNRDHCIYGSIWGTHLKLLKWVRTAPGERPPRGWTRIKLPAKERADKWWEQLMENDIVDFWVCDSEDDDEVVLCAAKPCIWKPKDTVHAVLAKRDFRPILHEAFEEYCEGYFDRSVFTAILNEVRLVGFSVRRKIRASPT